MVVNKCEDCKIHELIKNRCDESVLQEFIDSYCNKCDNNIREYTEDEFIRIIESKETDSKLKVGDIIHLYHDLCDTFRVIDTNHDDSTSTVDIMPTTQVSILRFGDDNNYENSVVRKWINGPYINGFDMDVHYLLKPMVVSVNNNYLYNEFAKILSATEIGLINEHVLDNEGVKYPIFESGKWDDEIESRWVDKGDYGSTYAYWLRSRNTRYLDSVWGVFNSSDCDVKPCSFDFGVLPVLRF